MTKKEIITYSTLTLLGFAGIFIKGYLGGLLTGMAVTIILLVSIGKKVAQDAARQIDKNIRDHILTTDDE